MKATLEFNLPEEQDDFNLITGAGDMYSALFDIKSEIRSLRKYGTSKYGDTADKILDSIETLVGEVLDE